MKTQNKSKLTRSEDAALGQYLSEWPQNKSFAEIVELVKRDGVDDGLLVWQPFEYHDRDALAELITDKQGLEMDAEKEIAKPYLREIRKLRAALAKSTKAL